MKCLSFGTSPSRRCLSTARPCVPDRNLAPLLSRRGARRSVTVSAATPDPEQVRKMQESMEEAMKENPQLREKMDQMQEALKNPQVQQQMQQTMAYMQSDATRKKVDALRQDPELKAKFEEIEKGGFGAMMKAMGDVKFLEKVGRAVGPPPGMSMTPESVKATSEVASAVTDTGADLAMPEINTILDAAKYGDVEAVEDFLAIGKDPNLVDEYNRSPLHFAVSIQHMEIIEALLSAGANVEMSDSKKNTPLHYAAGYGRVQALKRLLDAGADGSVKNDSGKSPSDVARLSDKNPILTEPDLMQKLDDMASN